MFQTFPSSFPLAAVFFLAITMQTPLAAPAEFVAVRHNPDFVLPEIVFPAGDDTRAGFDFEKLSKTTQVQDRWVQVNPALEAVRYLREGIQRMTGKTLPVVAGKDKGIVLTTLREAPPEVQNDPEVKKALRNTGEDAYNANEAFFIRTEPDRILIVTNTAEGLNHAVAELLESVGYEVLGMGPNWTYVPDFRSKPLVFKLQASGRPGFYIRSLGLEAGQGHGIGTLFKTPLPDAGDETVEISYNRWSIGTHIVGKSMPPFLGHVMQNYAQAVAGKMKELNSPDGFLHAPGSEIVFKKDVGKTMVKENGTFRSVKLDLSVPFVREIILEDLKKKSEAHFTDKDTGNEVFLFGTESEDGVQPIEFIRYPNWYPEYLKKEGVPFGKPYVLNSFKGLQQPNETWDPAAFTDTVFGFNNWLLREYDKWIDSLPVEQRKTAEGLPKKEMIRTSLLSYSTHDVPPNFNLDPRIRVMIAGYPAHRGVGKWKQFASQLDMAKAFKIMLPGEPSGDYWVFSFAYYRDFDMAGIRGSRLAKTVQQQIRDEYDAGIRAMHMESDLNFGKMGLEYYLYAKMLWNPGLSAPELEALRERWLQRAYGGGWKEMNAYYDFMAPENSSISAPNIWARAIRMIDAADKKIDPVREPDAKRRIDDFKQFWYYYYLVASGQISPPSEALREFLWKGQMSYMTAMHMVAGRYFDSHRVREIVGPELSSGPAHYTSEETQQWWNKILDYWKVAPVSEFTEAKLADGRSGKDVDLNDLVMVREFQSAKPDERYFYYDSQGYKTSVLTVATAPGEEIGFKLSWPYNPSLKSSCAMDVEYGIARWNPASKSWDDLVDITMTRASSKVMDCELPGKEGTQLQLLEIRYAAPSAGTYRIDIGNAGTASKLGSLDFNAATDTYTGVRPFSFSTLAAGYTQSPAYFYIPKGTKSLDFEVWGRPADKVLQLYTGLPGTGLKPCRKVALVKEGTQKVALNPGEDGSIASFSGNLFNMPQLYSVPQLWSKSPDALLVPREIAGADGLNILKSTADTLQNRP